jgi:hypothetical protein
MAIDGKKRDLNRERHDARRRYQRRNDQGNRAGKKQAQPRGHELCAEHRRNHEAGADSKERPDVHGEP